MKEYEEIKRKLLREFKINPIKLRDDFFSMRKAKDETYTSFANKLHNSLLYYFQSREVDTFDQVVSLICADRIKELLPGNSFDFVLVQEQEAWMSYDVLAISVNKYDMSYQKRSTNSDDV